MPSIRFKHFDAYREAGVLKGVFLGGCVARGDGSSFRRRAHAHNMGGEHDGWICVRSRRRLMTKTGKPSDLMWHELAHILTPNHGHDDKWRETVRKIGGKVRAHEEKGARHRHKWVYSSTNVNGDHYRCANGCSAVQTKRGVAV